jgi:hypothetical protein
MVLEFYGGSLRAGRPAYTDDDRLWDGDRFYRLVDKRVVKRQSILLSRADVILINVPGCNCNRHCGTVSAAPEKTRQRLVSAGFVRFADGDGELQRWQADDGTVLALLVGEIIRPVL